MAKKKKKNKADVVVQFDKRFRISFRVVFTLLLVFAGCMGMAFTFAKITEVRHLISDARFELQTKQDDNISLRTQITEKYSLDEIERIAIDKLGMIKPDQSQIVHIYVPRQSHSELSVVNEPEPESLWETVTSFFQNLITFEE